jgi:hypothetical protein
MGEVQAQPTGVVIPFPDPASRGMRPMQASNGPRGEVLLFTGIRYDWQPEPNPASPSPSPSPLVSGSPRPTGRRRRRS